MGSYTMGMDFLFWKMKTVLEIYNGNDCIMMCIHLMPLNWTLKWLKGQIYSLYFTIIKNSI